jgi:hypothetical protein
MSDITEVVLRECAALENILNNTLLHEFVKLHNIDPKYCHLQLKQEVLAESSIFFTKKKYGLYIINKEGKNVSEYDIKGMILRKSNFPEFSKEKIYTLLDMILKENPLDINKIKNYIKHTETEFIDLCKERSKIITGAVSFSKPLSEYKQIPYQVHGMILWNELEYKYFVPGTKGYLFRIKGIDVMNAPERVVEKIKRIGSNHKHIVIPYEEEKLPEYYIIDSSAQIKFAWADRVKEVVGALLTTSKYDFDQAFE